MRYAYEDDDFEHELVETWRTLQPLYKELFTYVRRKLIQRYGESVIRPDGPLPVHLVGDMWGQDWSMISDILLPYPSSRNLDVTNDMLRQGFTTLRYIV